MRFLRNLDIFKIDGVISVLKLSFKKALNKMTSEEFVKYCLKDLDAENIV